MSTDADTEISSSLGKVTKIIGESSNAIKGWGDLARICENLDAHLKNGKLRTIQAIRLGAEMLGRHKIPCPPPDDGDLTPLCRQAHTLGLPLVAFMQAAGELANGRHVEANGTLVDQARHNRLPIGEVVTFTDLCAVITQKFPELPSSVLGFLGSHFDVMKKHNSQHLILS